MSLFVPNAAIALMLSMSLAAADPAGGREAAPGASSVVRPEMLSSIQDSISAIRGHGYMRPVSLEVMSESDVAAYLKRKLAEEYPEAAIDDEQKAYVHFGLLKPDDDLETLFLGLLTEQAAGFYDPQEKRLFVVTGKPFPGVALVHELAHALQDQVFDVGPFLERAKGEDDRLRAAQAMIEGEAMEISTAYIMKHPEQAGMLLGMGEGGGGAGDLSGALGDSLETLRRFPDVLQADLLFPYTEGLKWASAIVRSGGRALMDSIYKDPPESTEQILHPEKIMAPRDRPSTIPRDTLPDLSSSGYRIVKVNTWGEFSTRQLLGGDGSQEAVAAATGWDGDLYAVYEAEGGETAMIWITVWDSAGDAAEFREGVDRWLRRRHPDGAGFDLIHMGPESRLVAVIEGFDALLASRIGETLERRLPESVALR